MFASDFDELFETEEMWATPGFEAIATWSLSPGLAERRKLIADDWAQWGHLFGDRAEVLCELDLLALEPLPDGPLWYVEALCTDPAQRRRGHATTAIRPGLERAERDAIPAALDTANPEALPFYRRLGFREVDTCEVGDAPKLWVLLREPQGSLLSP